ncbi:MAG: hypothetical protein AVDCRST_MAG95-889 [uncultured Adhaeribacter sp.]|uniref:Uncharacterized protein n=1 Tax=uncultured Adhaeribacter sp. TaxID=448109 RepID=A0A6J4HR20_9BACT|nr:MAG: hypothetical protein AVDCRST_MAG95-889 [uncultured Adhaeribacter sp.]
MLNYELGIKNDVSILLSRNIKLYLKRKLYNHHFTFCFDDNHF